MDGQVLRNQDLSEGQVSTDGMCKPPGGPSLFYSATLIEGQALQIIATQTGSTFRAPLFLMLKEGCADRLCRGSMGDRLDYTNTGPGTKTVVVEVSSFPGQPVTLFDLMVSIPLPPAGILVEPTRGLQTTESGGTATFKVALTSPPTHPVLIPLDSSDPAEGTVSPSSVQFDPASWQQPQTVTVTGADDSSKDGARPYSVRVGPPISQDERWARLPPAQVALVNRDDEAGFAFDARTPLSTSESGAKSTFTVVLNRAPSATVRLPLASSDAGEGVVTPAELVFEPQSWNQAQTVTVTGVDDPDRDGAQSYRVVTGVATSADPEYAGIDPDDLEARNADNEFERVAAQLVSGDLVCFSGGGVARKIAADRAGTLFVAMACQRPFGSSGGGGSGGSSGMGGAGGSGGAPVRPPPADAPPSPIGFVATSIDGGRTWRAPVDTRLFAFDITVAAGDSGFAVVAGQGPLGISVARTDDGGMTWQPPTTLANSGGNLQLAAAGNRVVLSAETNNGPTLWISQDAGQTWKQSPTPGQRPAVAVGVDPGGDVIWVVTYDGTLVWRPSRDGGATFDMGLTLSTQMFYDALGVSPTTIYAAGKESQLLAVPRDGSPRRGDHGARWRDGLPARAGRGRLGQRHGARQRKRNGEGAAIARGDLDVFGRQVAGLRASDALGRGAVRKRGGGQPALPEPDPGGGRDLALKI